MSFASGLLQAWNETSAARREDEKEAAKIAREDARHKELLEWKQKEFDQNKTDKERTYALNVAKTQSAINNDNSAIEMRKKQYEVTKKQTEANIKKGEAETKIKQSKENREANKPTYREEGGQLLQIRPGEKDWSVSNKVVEEVSMRDPQGNPIAYSQKEVPVKVSQKTNYDAIKAKQKEQELILDRIKDKRETLKDLTLSDEEKLNIKTDIKNLESLLNEEKPQGNNAVGDAILKHLEGKKGGDTQESKTPGGNPQQSNTSTIDQQQPKKLLNEQGVTQSKPNKAKDELEVMMKRPWSSLSGEERRYAQALLKEIKDKQSWLNDDPRGDAIVDLFYSWERQQ